MGYVFALVFTLHSEREREREREVSNEKQHLPTFLFFAVSSNLSLYHIIIYSLIQKIYQFGGWQTTAAEQLRIGFILY